MSSAHESFEPNSIKRYPVARLREGTLAQTDDCLVVEEPLEIRINGRRFTATMRTPGYDLELVRGLLFTEGVVQRNDDIEEILLSTQCRELTDELVNMANVIVPELDEIPAHLWERALISNSSCGLCGKASIEALKTRVSPLPQHSPISSQMLFHLPQRMREGQAVFQHTGGLHAAAIFNKQGSLLALFEDIGRHNATDKAIGFALQAGWLPCSTEHGPLVLLVSGRSSFEITQKALMARIPIVCSVSAASTLAVDLAAANNQTLIGFLRDRSLVIYHDDNRISAA